jgi:Transaldolase/Fructose-6-phosphate aldolase
MNPTQALHEAGQSLWLDNITRALLDEGTLARYIAEYSVTGLTSNPTIFDRAIKDGAAYDADIAARMASGASDEEVFFDLALADLRRAAGLFAPVHARTDTVDGWVSLEVSPLLAHDPARTVDQARDLHRRAALDNLFIKIPGTPEAVFGRLALRMSYVSGDVRDDALYRRLAATIGPGRRPVYYLEVPPALFGPSWSTSARPGCCATAGSRSRSRSGTTWPRPAS